MPISRIFGVSDPAGSFLGLVQLFCTLCTFYHILLLSLSHAYRLFLRYALLHRFVSNSFYSSKHLCACFITFHVAAVVVHLLLCRLLCAFLTDRFYGCSYMYGCWLLIWMLTAYNVNYKDPWRYPVKPDRVIGLCIVSDAIQVIRS